MRYDVFRQERRCKERCGRRWHQRLESGGEGVVLRIQVFFCGGAAEPARDRAGRRRDPVQDQVEHALPETYERLLRPSQLRAEHNQVRIKWLLPRFLQSSIFIKLFPLLVLLTEISKINLHTSCRTLQSNWYKYQIIPI